MRVCDVNPREPNIAEAKHVWVRTSYLWNAKRPSPYDRNTICVSYTRYHDWYHENEGVSDQIGRFPIGTIWVCMEQLC